MILSLKERRAKHIADGRAIIDKAKGEGRDQLNAEEQANWDKAMADADALGAQVKVLERQEAAEADMNSGDRRSTGHPPAKPNTSSKKERNPDMLRSQFRSWMRTGHAGDELRAEQRARQIELQTLMLGLTEQGEMPDHELRGWTLGSSTQAGSMIAPVEINKEIFRKMNDETFMLQECHVKTVNAAAALGIRRVTTRMSDFDWTTEVASVTEDTDHAGDRRDMTPKLSSKLAKLSLTLAQLSSEPEQEITDEIAYKQGVTLERYCLIGSGSGQPLGLFIASANGISTGRDYTIGNSGSGGTITADAMIQMKYQVRKPYRRHKSCGWTCHRDMISKLRQLKGSDGHYLWKAGLAKDDDDTFLSNVIRESEFAPNSFATGAYPIVYGALRYYTIAMYKDMPIQRLVELYAGNNQIGFIGRMWADGQPIQEEAFVRGKIVAP